MADQPWWMSLLIVAGGFALLSAAVYLSQAVLSAFNGTTSDGVVVGHLRYGVGALAVGFVLWLPMLLDIRRDRRRREEYEARRNRH